MEDNTHNPQPAQPATSGNSSDWSLGMVTWVLGLLFGILGPLIIWVVKKDDSPYMDQVGKTVLNFNISYAIWMFVSALLMFLVIGFVLFPVVLIMFWVFSIMGAIKANRGESDWVPFGTLKLLK